MTPVGMRESATLSDTIRPWPMTMFYYLLPHDCLTPLTVIAANEDHARSLRQRQPNEDDFND